MSTRQWTVEHSPERSSFIRTGDERYKIVISGPHWTDPEREAIANLIVRSVNLHDELVAALQAAADDHQCAIRCDGPHPDCICWYCRIGAVLKKAEAP